MKKILIIVQEEYTQLCLSYFKIFFTIDAFNTISTSPEPYEIFDCIFIVTISGESHKEYLKKKHVAKKHRDQYTSIFSIEITKIGKDPLEDKTFTPQDICLN